MNAVTRLALAGAFLGLCLALPVRADQPEQRLADPGFRPESALSATFIEHVSAAEISVFPTIIRTTDETAYSSTSQQWVVEFLALNNLGMGSVADSRFDMRSLQGASQWEMFQSSMAVIGRHLGELYIEGDYALVIEILIPPIPPMSISMEVFGIHCFVLEPDGSNAFSFLLNSHHRPFNDANLRTSDVGETGKQWLARESTRLALMALKAQVDQEREAAQPGSTSTHTTMVDDFESALASGTDSVGLPVGFDTFADATSSASISATVDYPPLPSETKGNHVLKLDLDLTGWAGLIHSFGNETVDRWTSRDWKASLGIRFWLYGNNTGTSLFVDVLDNRERYSTTDDAERYTYEFRDDFAGWKQLTVPFAKMVRKEIHNRTPNDGLNLSEVHGWAFGNSSSVGKVTYYIDDFELYGGRVNLPSEEPLSLTTDSRWQNRQTTAGRFRVSLAVRMDPPWGAEPADFPKLAILDWYYGARVNGMPKNEKELLKILSWARRLDELLVAERAGFQFATRGGANKLGAYFYVTDLQKLKTLSGQAGEQALKTRLNLRISDDPTWEEWRKMGRSPEGEGKSATNRAEGTAIPVSAMEPVLRFAGFSVRRPNDYRWRLLRNNWRPDIANFTFAPLSATHSFNAAILIRGLPKEFHTREDFKAFIDSKVPDSGPRFKNLTFESSMTELYGQWAVEYQALFLDTAPANSATPLHMTIKGVTYMHPLRPGRVIDAYYSERGTKDDLDGSLDPIGEELINGTIPER